ncbi:tensin-3-like isoform X3 [Tachypleus tridentatus]|uniref:tensin-3-like isoform X3 n=1 Tax=Tachypleus tridentatus TaxID=6853 RepID=UPI003FD2C883
MVNKPFLDNRIPIGTNRFPTTKAISEQTRLSTRRDQSPPRKLLQESPDATRAIDFPSSSRREDKLPLCIMDITYVTERIIVLTFPELETDVTYRSNLKEAVHMLQTKHGDNYMVLNLSEQREVMVELNSQVQDYGWPSDLAPELERLFKICDTIDRWLRNDPQHTVVLHSKGDRGRIGVVIAAYMSYSNVKAGTEQALDRFSMKKLYDEKFSQRMQPSQIRYVQNFSALLTSVIQANKAVFYLNHIVIQGTPNFESKGYQPFVKIYQGIKPVYTSDVYTVTKKTQKVMIAISPSLPLCGDVIIKCYHRQQKSAGKEIVFRVQFHTWTLDQNHLIFSKNELDGAISDFRFPNDGKVELQFSSHPDGFRGSDSTHSTITSTNFSDFNVRWDSYGNFVMEYPNKSDPPNSVEAFDGSLHTIINKDSTAKDFPQAHESANYKRYSEQNGSRATSQDSGISSSSTVHGCSSLSVASQPQSPDLINELTNQPSFNIIGSKKHRQHTGIEKERKKNESTIESQQAELDELMKNLLEVTETLPDPQLTKSAQYQSLISFPSTLNSPTYTEKHNRLAAVPSQCYVFTEKDKVNSEKVDNTLRKTPTAIFDHESGQPYKSYLKNAHKPLFLNSAQSSAHSLLDENTATKKSYGITRRIHESSPKNSLQNLPANGHLVSNDNKWFHKKWHMYLLKLEGPRKQEQLLREQQLISELKNFQAKKHQTLSSPDVNDIASSTSMMQISLPQRSGSFEPLYISTSDEDVSSNCDSLNLSISANHIFQFTRNPSPEKCKDEEMVQIRHYQKPGNSSSVTSPYSVEILDQTNFQTEVIKEPDKRNSNKTAHNQNSEKLDSQIDFKSLGVNESNQMDYQVDSVNKTSGYQNSCRIGLEPKMVNHLSRVNGCKNKDCYCDMQKSFINGFGQQDPYTSPWQFQVHVSDSQGSCCSVQDFIVNDCDYGGSCMYNEQKSEINIFNQEVDHTDSDLVLRKESELHYAVPFSSKTLPTTVRPCSSTEKLQTYHNNMLFNVVDCISANSQSTNVQLNFSSPKHASPDHCWSSSHIPRPGSLEEVPYQETPTFNNLTPPQNGDSVGEDASIWSPSTDSSSSIPTISFTPPTPETLNVTEKVPFTGFLNKVPECSTLPRTEIGHLYGRLVGGQSPPTSSQSSMLSLTGMSEVTMQQPLFSKDSSKYWYRPDMSKDEATDILKDKPPGTFLVRNSFTFPGCFGLAIKVPSSSAESGSVSGKLDPRELVRHLLIESTSAGVRIKGSLEEPVFGSLSALIYQHSITPLSLSCRLLLPESESTCKSGSTCASRQERQVDGGKMLYLRTMDMETLTGPQAVQKAVSELLLLGNDSIASTIVRFRATDKGITITDISHKLFFRCHYPICSISYCGFDPDNRCWIKENVPGDLPPISRRCFGFIAKKPTSDTENQCHIFAEIESSHPASVIVSLVESIIKNVSKQVKFST